MSSNNHEDIFTLIVERYYKEIFNHCYVQLNFQKQDGEECAQRVFLLLFEQWNKIGSLENIRAWLYKTAGYVVSNYRRKEKRVFSNLDDLEETKDLAQSREFDAIETLLILSDNEKNFVRLYYESGLTVRELSKKMNLSEAAIYKRVSRIKNKLLQCEKMSKLGETKK